MPLDAVVSDDTDVVDSVDVAPVDSLVELVGVEVVVVDEHDMGNVDGHDESFGWKQAVDWLESVQ